MRKTDAAELYVALHRGVTGDVAFYKAGCDGEDSVLELGVGDARVLSRLECRERWGLDRDPAMLALAARRDSSSPPLNLLPGDMAAVSLPRRFERIVIPYNGLLCLEPAAKAACLARIKELLTASGRLLFDVYFADELHQDSDDVTAEPEQDDEEFLVELSVGKRRFSVFEQNLWWPSERRLQACYRFQQVGQRQPSPEVQTRIDHYYLLEADISPLLKAAGFSTVKKKMFNAEQEQVGITAW